jgi:hypothetical protein
MVSSRSETKNFFRLPAILDWTGQKVIKPNSGFQNPNSKTKAPNFFFKTPKNFEVHFASALFPPKILSCEMQKPFHSTFFSQFLKKPKKQG